MNPETDIAAVRAEVANLKEQIGNLRSQAAAQPSAPFDGRLTNLEQKVSSLANHRDALRGEAPIRVNRNVIGIDASALGGAGGGAGPGTVGIVSGCLNGVFTTRQVVFVG